MLPVFYIYAILRDYKQTYGVYDVPMFLITTCISQNLQLMLVSL